MFLRWHIIFPVTHLILPVYDMTLLKLKKKNHKPLTHEGGVSHKLHGKAELSLCQLHLTVFCQQKETKGLKEEEQGAQERQLTEETRAWRKEKLGMKTEGQGEIFRRFPKATTQFLKRYWGNIHKKARQTEKIRQGPNPSRIVSYTSEQVHASHIATCQGRSVSPATCFRKKGMIC